MKTYIILSQEIQVNTQRKWPSFIRIHFLLFLIWGITAFPDRYSIHNTKTFCLVLENKTRISINTFRVSSSQDMKEMI
jgi:hypothetical protein